MSRLRHTSFTVRMICRRTWAIMMMLVRPGEGIPRPTPEEIDQIIDEWEGRYLPALRAYRDRGHRVPAPREAGGVSMTCSFRPDTPMSDHLHILDLIAEEKLGHPEQE